MSICSTSMLSQMHFLLFSHVNVTPAPPPPSHVQGAARSVWKFAFAKMQKFHTPPPTQMYMHIFSGEGVLFGRLSREDFPDKTYKGVFLNQSPEIWGISQKLPKRKEKGV